METPAGTETAHVLMGFVGAGAGERRSGRRPDDGGHPECVPPYGVEPLLRWRPGIRGQEAKSGPREQSAHFGHREQADGVDLRELIDDATAVEDEEPELYHNPTPPSVHAGEVEADDLVRPLAVDPGCVAVDRGRAVPELEDIYTAGSKGPADAREVGGEGAIRGQVAEPAKHADRGLEPARKAEPCHVTLDERDREARAARLRPSLAELSAGQVEPRDGVAPPREDQRVAPRPAAEVEDRPGPACGELPEHGLPEVAVDRVIVLREPLVRRHDWTMGWSTIAYRANLNRRNTVA